VQMTGADQGNFSSRPADCLSHIKTAALRRAHNPGADVRRNASRARFAVACAR